VIVVRRDLRLRRAEMASLVAKASIRFFLDNDVSSSLESLEIQLSKAESAWLSDPQVIVLGVPTLGTLESLAFKAENLGLSTYSITTKRKLDPDDEKSPVTDQLAAVSIGPDSSESLDIITAKLKLL
jgi:peptidyl-tRNA hydrolase